jgi:fido (protein-threonine AMPylation protein)
LIDTAQKHIEKQVDINEAKSLIAGYYQTANRRETISNNEEADKAAVNIVQVLSEQAFSFSVEGLAGLHRRIFHGIFKHAGEFRHPNLRQTIQYDLDQEKQFRYKGLTMDASIEHFATFIA